MTTVTATKPDHATRWLPATLLGAAALVWYFVLALLVVSRLFPLVAGWSPVVITSGSMQPHIQPGDVVIYQPSDGIGLAPGTVVTFVDPANPDGLVTHRIEAVNADGSYVTKGDANRLSDSTAIAPESIEGVGKLVVPLAGLPLVWAAQGQMLLLAGFVLVLVSAKSYLSVVEGRAVRFEARLEDREAEATPRFGLTTRVALAVAIVAVLFAVVV